MGLTNIIFIFFILPIFFLIYYIAPSKWRNIVLVLASLLILGWKSPIFLPIIFNICLLNFWFGFLIFNLRTNAPLKKGVYFAIIIFNIIAFLAYLVFNFNSFKLFGQEIAKPVMLSFCILSNISYVTDIYIKRCRPQNSFIDYLTYAIMFPKMFLGPAVCYYKFNDQLRERKLNSDITADGINLFICGFAKKCLLADNIVKMYIFIIDQNVSGLSVVTAWLGAIAIFFNLYFVLSGYIDMARGLGKMLGFNLPINFRPPLSARSITNFIRRFNISIIYWFKVYINPPQLKNKGFFFTSIRVCLIGIAYALFFGGTACQFLAVFYFIALFLIEKLFLFDFFKSLPTFIRNIITFILVIFGVMFFEQGSVGEGINYLGAMFGTSGIFIDKTSIFLIISFGVTIILCWLCASSILKIRLFKIKRKYKTFYAVSKPICLLILFVISLAFCSTNQGIISLV